MKAFAAVTVSMTNVSTRRGVVSSGATDTKHPHTIMLVHTLRPEYKATSVIVYCTDN